MVKIMPINCIATRADLNELIAGFDYQAFERRQEEHPTLPVEKLLLICMGHEPDFAAALQNEVLHKLDIEVVDILRDKSKLEFKRESKAKIVRSQRTPNHRAILPHEPPPEVEPDGRKRRRLAENLSNP